MLYKYARSDNYEDFAAGRVLLHQSGGANFPVRLAQEIFMRCLEYSPKSNDLTLFDPCCGGGYLPTVLGFLNAEKIARIVGSDIDERAVRLAGDNLALLTEEGLARRTAKIVQMHAQDGKQSHMDALTSAKKLRELISPNPPATAVFAADALNEQGWANRALRADIVITDIPYGKLASWQGDGDTHALLQAIRPSLAPRAVVAICSQKHDRIHANGFVRREKQSIGKRKFEIYLPDTLD